MATIDFAAMTDNELNVFLDDAFEEEYIPTCPHCDAALHGPTNYCWCAGCDACELARNPPPDVAIDNAAEIALALAELARRNPPADPAPVVPYDENEPF